MPSKCCVKNCSKRAGRDVGFSFFRFPSLNTKTKELEQLTTKRRAAWLYAINRTDIKEESLKHTRICSDHFITGSPAKLDDELHPDWAPNLNMNKPKRKRVYKQPFKRKVCEIKTRESIPDLLHRVETASTTEEDELKMESELDEFELSNTVSDPLEMQPEEISSIIYEDKLKIDNEFEKLKQEIIAKNELIESYEAKLKKHEQDKIEITKEYELQIESRDIQIKDLVKEIRKKNLCIESFRNNDNKVRYFTGLPNFTALIYLFGHVREDLKCSMKKKINVFDAFIMTLLKLRLDLPYTYLSYNFGVSTSTISKMFHENITILHDKISSFVRWPDESEFQLKTPTNVFADSVTTVIDFFEIFVERPGEASVRSEVFSSDSNDSTMKYLIAISPDGAIIFVSKGYGGTSSEETIVETSGFMDFINPGDVILSDHGKVVNIAVLEKNTKLLVPNSHTQLDELNLKHTKKLSKVRTQVIGTLRQKYQILAKRKNLTTTLKSDGDKRYLDFILKCCCALLNLCPQGIKTPECEL